MSRLCRFKFMFLLFGLRNRIHVVQMDLGCFVFNLASSNVTLGVTFLVGLSESNVSSILQSSIPLFFSKYRACVKSMQYEQS